MAKRVTVNVERIIVFAGGGKPLDIRWSEPEDPKSWEPKK
jgi:hypothetical protein